MTKYSDMHGIKYFLSSIRTKMQFSHAQSCHFIANLNLFGWRDHDLILTILFLLTSSQLLEIVMTSLHVACTLGLRV